MAYKQVYEISPVVSAADDCPMNCIGCKHLVGIHFWDESNIDVDCDLKDE